MATATVNIALTVQGATQQEANQKALQGARDFAKQNLAVLNGIVGKEYTEADVDAMNATALQRVLDIVVRNFVVESVKAWRVRDAEAQHVQPVREAAGYVDEPDDSTLPEPA